MSSKTAGTNTRYWDLGWFLDAKWSFISISRAGVRGGPRVLGTVLRSQFKSKYKPSGSAKSVRACPTLFFVTEQSETGTNNQPISFAAKGSGYDHEKCEEHNSEAAALLHDVISREYDSKSRKSFKKGIEDYLESLRQGFAEGDEEEDEDDDMGRDDEDGPEDDDFVLTPPVSSSSTGKDEDKSDGPALKIKNRMVESADESASPMLKVKRRSSNSSIGSGISDGKGSGGRKKRKKKKSSNVPEAIPMIGIAADPVGAGSLALTDVQLTLQRGKMNYGIPSWFKVDATYTDTPRESIRDRDYYAAHAQVLASKFQASMSCVPKLYGALIKGNGVVLPDWEGPAFEPQYWMEQNAGLHGRPGHVLIDIIGGDHGRGAACINKELYQNTPELYTASELELYVGHENDEAFMRFLRLKGTMLNKMNTSQEKTFRDMIKSCRNAYMRTKDEPAHCIAQAKKDVMWDLGVKKGVLSLIWMIVKREARVYDLVFQIIKGETAVYHKTKKRIKPPAGYTPFQPMHGVSDDVLVKSLTAVIEGRYNISECQAVWKTYKAKARILKLGLEHVRLMDSSLEKENDQELMDLHQNVFGNAFLGKWIPHFLNLPVKSAAPTAFHEDLTLMFKLDGEENSLMDQKKLVGDGKADTYFCCSSADGLTQFQSHLGNYNSCTHLVQQLKRPYAVISKDPSFGCGRHNKNGVKWDERAPTVKERKTCMQISNLYNTSETGVWFEYTTVQQAPGLMETMEEAGWFDAHMLYFWKHDQNRAGLNQYVWSVELAVIAYRPSMAKNRFLGPANPLTRQNLIVTKGMAKRRLADAGGEPVNLTEKHPMNSRTIANRHGTPGSWAMVLGLGAGGDAEGFLRSGMNVVGIEYDRLQWNAANARIHKLLTADDFKTKLLWGDEKDPAEDMSGFTLQVGAEPIAAEEVPEEEAVPEGDEQVVAAEVGVGTCAHCLVQYSAAKSIECAYATCGTSMHSEPDCIKHKCEKCEGSFCIKNHKGMHGCNDPDKE